MHLQLPGCALLLSNTTYLILTERLSTMSRYIYPPAATSISLSPHMKSLVFGSSQSSLLISTTFSLFCRLFLPLYVLYFTTSSTNPPPSHQVIKLNAISFNSTALQLSFHLHFHSHFNSSVLLLIPNFNVPTLTGQVLEDIRTI